MWYIVIVLSTNILLYNFRGTESDEWRHDRQGSMSMMTTSINNGKQSELHQLISPSNSRRYVERSVFAENSIGQTVCHLHCRLCLQCVQPSPFILVTWFTSITRYFLLTNILFVYGLTACENTTKTKMDKIYKLNNKVLRTVFSFVCFNGHQLWMYAKNE